MCWHSLAGLISFFLDSMLAFVILNANIISWGSCKRNSPFRGRGEPYARIRYLCCTCDLIMDRTQAYWSMSMDKFYTCSLLLGSM